MSLQVGRFEVVLTTALKIAFVDAATAVSLFCLLSKILISIFNSVVRRVSVRSLRSSKMKGLEISCL